MQKVYILDINDVLKHKNRIIELLDKTSVIKAESFAVREDKLRCLGGALLVKAFTAKEETKYNKYNKPFKNIPPFFNVSHSGEKVGIYLNDNSDVGFDIQRIKNSDGKLIDYIFSEKEKINGVDKSSFAVRWTMTEAAAKCIGTGLLSIKRQKISDITENYFLFDGEKIYYKNFIVGDYAITCCSFNVVKTEIIGVDCEIILKTLAKKL